MKAGDVVAIVETESERYQRYLAGREWSVRKEAVRRRSGGICERCQYHQMNHVHHLTYARKYNEPLDDLQAICKGCHDFIHAKSNTDPVETAPILLNGKQIRNVYLAGKITGTTWRDQITKLPWSRDNEGLVGYGWNASEWATVSECIPIPGKKQMLGMTGPWWRPLAMYGGHGNNGTNSYSHSCGTKECEPEYDNHGCFVGAEMANYTPDEERLLKAEIRSNIFQGIETCDLLFAWIDTLDCFGTIAEIGIARRAGKHIAIGVPSQLDASELWFVLALANTVTTVRGHFPYQAKAAWDSIWTGKQPARKQART